MERIQISLPSSLATFSRILYLYLLISSHASAAQIFLRIHHDTLTTCQRLFKEWISRSERNSVVATFDNQIDLGQHSPHLREARGMMTQVIGSWKRFEGRKDGSWDEGRGGAYQLPCHLSENPSFRVSQRKGTSHVKTSQNERAREVRRLIGLWTWAYRTKGMISR